MDHDRSTVNAEITERSHGPDGTAFDHLVVRYTRGWMWPKELLVGAYDGPVSAEVVSRFRDGVCAGATTEREPELVHNGPPAGEELTKLARDSGIWLREVAEYQQVWEHSGYVQQQTARLLADNPEYPLQRHVDKRWSDLGETSARATTASEQIMDWFTAIGPRFVLVLGDFGTGKTFLLRSLAARLARESDLVPVLVTMRELSKGLTLEKLLAQHMSGHESYHHASFRYLLRHGRIALLFDGFDELVARTDYDRVKDHFATLREAAGGDAKVIVTSRHQHFATDSDARTALGGEARALPGSRTMRLLPLDSGQRRQLVVEAFDDESAADRFLKTLGDVRDLLDLAGNPRMLSFMIHWYRKGLLDWTEEAAASGERITAGLLYERLMTTWLQHEQDRQTTAGGPRVFSVDQRFEALTHVALHLWNSGEAGVRAVELGQLAEQVSDLAALQMRTGEAAHAVGSGTVLVRRDDDAFGFIHQSVQEWFVARWIADDPDERLRHRSLSPLTVDFLCDLAGDAAVVDWARRIARAHRADGLVTKANAALVLQRRGVTVSAVSYAGQDLRGRDLSGQDLSGADLRGADLSGATLPRSLRGTDLREARLIGSLLDGINLTNADLSDADLTGARLLGADLTGVQLEDARLDRTVLLGTGLTNDALTRAAGSAGAALPGSSVVNQLGMASPTLTAIAVADLLATGHDDGSVRLSDPSTGTALRVLRGHHAPVRALVADPQGRWLASAGDDATVRIWDPTTGEHRHTLTGHTGSVRALVADPQGRWLASAGDDATVRIWDPTTGELLVTLVASEDGWAALLPDGSYKVHGQPAGLWWAAGLCRFEAHDLPALLPYQPHLRPLADDAVVLRG